MTATAGQSIASLRVTRLVAVSLGLGGLILFVFDLSLVIGQARVFAPWWSLTATTGVVGAGIAVAVVGLVGTPRATVVAFRVLAAAMLAVALLALVAVPGGESDRSPGPPICWSSVPRRRARDCRCRRPWPISWRCSARSAPKRSSSSCPRCDSTRCCTCVSRCSMRPS
ncbi:hypothetical protein GCM10025881_36160 [Pseudolysinimonas kribbensis]|uniref:Uncharacterized protein n=1 Tax=Pseudolysinimonas kribbensis TaxID=433641 RepID=A0ABQ6K7Z7_9MICO|nr:hypothetical protein GCM10025881_36160 [Pseudolysinimonas kribbensis]